MAMKGETVFSTPWFQITTVPSLPGPDAAAEPYYTLVRNNGVIAFVLDERGRVILIEQYRPPLERTTLEMPAGGIEPGETPLQAVARELLEETGYVCSSFTLATSCRLMLNRESAVEHFFVGLGARLQPNTPVREKIQVRAVERERLLELVATNRFEQTVALGAVYTVQKIYGIDLLTTDLGTIESRLRQ